MENSRRKFLQQAALVTAGGFAASLTSAENIFKMNRGEQSSPGDFTLPALQYAYDALEPHIDKMTMEIHHTKHHQAYVNNLNKALADLGKKDTHGSLEEICKSVSTFNTAVRNNAGGHYNHSMFWKLMKPSNDGISTPKGELLNAISGTFSSVENFKTLYSDKAKSVFGSGWTWLIVNANKKLVVGTTPNQDNPLMDISELKGIPILALDVWEHAYYLKYQNKRVDYISAWWNVVNWEQASQQFSAAMK
jgi:Fe-Mn family superoxide dismutase